MIIDFELENEIIRKLSELPDSKFLKYDIDKLDANRIMIFKKNTKKIIIKLSN